MNLTCLEYAFFTVPGQGHLESRTLRPMARLMDLGMLLIAIVSAPIWLPRMIVRGKHRTDWRARFGHTPILPPPTNDRVLLHAVSVGEVGAIRDLVRDLHQRDGIEVVVASTTDTGIARAKELFGDSITVVRWPLDFSGAVNRFLDAIAPTAVGLVELEVWPTMSRECAQRGIDTIVVSGRLSARSARRYGWIAPLVRPMFARVSRVAAQDDASASRFAAVGVPVDRIEVTGNMKWDSAGSPLTRDDAAQMLRQAMGLDQNRLLIVGGSTAPGEDELLLRSLPDGAQLLCAPRRPEWWDAAAATLSPCTRRSTGELVQGDHYLLDTIGDLSDAYTLADIVVVGRSFGDLHGSDPIEPVARGAATIIGPRVTDFQDITQLLSDGGGLVQCTAEDLPGVLSELAADPAARASLVAAGRMVIDQQQGATARCADLLASACSQKSTTAA